MMVANSPKYFIRVTGILLLILVSASLFWCGDVDCVTPGSDESCGSLACALLKPNTPAGEHQSDTFGGSECACVCHVPTVVTHTADALVPFIPGAVPPVVHLAPPSTPNTLVFRPPITA